MREVGKLTDFTNVKSKPINEILVSDNLDELKEAYEILEGLRGEIEAAKLRIANNSLAKTESKMPPHTLLTLSQLFIPKDIQEFALGDIYEKFESDVEKSGERTAKLNLCKNILSSICPFVWGFVRAKFDKLVGRVEK